MLKQELKRRELPPLLSRDEMKEIIQRDLFGYLPDVPYTVTVGEPETVEGRFHAGQMVESRVTFTFGFEGGSHSFTVHRFLHIDGKKRPLVLYNNFHPVDSSQYIAREEICEYDADFLMYCYKDISSDDGDFTTGLAPYLLPNGKVGATTCGKIGIWAWANMRVLDYGLTLPGTDEKNVAILGHSRLGKTAMYTAMLDERIKFVFSSAAGCAGDSLCRGNSGFGHEDEPIGTRGELVADIVERFPYWFCENYYKCAETSIPETFDQHYLLAAIAPRYLLTCSYDMDPWADPKGQQLGILAASEAWEQQGLTGLLGASDHYFAAGEASLDGRVGYFVHHGLHFLSRHAWRRFMEFIEKHKNDR